MYRTPAVYSTAWASSQLHKRMCACVSTFVNKTLDLWAKGFFSFGLFMSSLNHDWHSCFVDGFPFVSWSVSHWVSRQDSWHLSAKMKAGLRNGYWTLHGKGVGSNSQIQPPLLHFGNSSFHIFVFPKRPLKLVWKRYEQCDQNQQVK